MTKSNTGIRGVAHLALYDELGNLKFEVVKHNLITTHGDEYYAKMGAAGVGGESAPTLVARMQLGTGTTAATKAGATTAQIETFIANSGVAFDDVSTSAVGSDTGWKIRYTTTWAAGTATNSAITEAVITEQTAANTASTVANTISRVVFTAINKGANDTLVLNWDHVFFDAV